MSERVCFTAEFNGHEVGQRFLTPSVETWEESWRARIHECDKHLLNASFVPGSVLLCAVKGQLAEGSLATGVSRTAPGVSCCWAHMGSLSPAQCRPQAPGEYSSAGTAPSAPGVGKAGLRPQPSRAPHTRLGFCCQLPPWEVAQRNDGEQSTGTRPDPPYVPPCPQKI